MTLAQIAVLAATQGLTEFLPVSSSGHLVLVREWLNISDINGGPLDAFLHLGTLLALLLYYWSVWVGLGRAIFTNDEEGRGKRELAGKLAVATVPGAIAGYFGQDWIESVLRGPAVLGMGFLLTAIVLVVAQVWSRREAKNHRASYADALWMGLAQVLALVPSLSRSGVTIAAGCGRGLSKKQATTFSFLMSAPIIAGAGLFSLRSLLEIHAFSSVQLLVGFVISFVAGYVAISLFMRWVQKISFWPFVVYLLALTAIVWIRF
jgi:undecaprenyl-diphosphatase